MPIPTRSPAEQHLRDRILGTVAGIDASNPNAHYVAQLTENFAYRTGDLNITAAWHTECVRSNFSTRVIRDAAFQLAHAMLAAQRAHDRLVTELTS